MLREAHTGLSPVNGPSARHEPTGVVGGTLAEYEEFLSHNELELAWDALAAVAERSVAPPSTWESLAKAAELMELHEKAREARSKLFRPSVASAKALEIASADAERVYRNVERFRISLALEADGWHIEYDLKSPSCVGGGPHYVIDATTGTIVSKKYFQ